MQSPRIPDLINFYGCGNYCITIPFLKRLIPAHSSFIAIRCTAFSSPAFFCGIIRNAHTNGFYLFTPLFLPRSPLLLGCRCSHLWRCDGDCDFYGPGTRRWRYVSLTLSDYNIVHMFHRCMKIISLLKSCNIAPGKT